MKVRNVVSGIRCSFDCCFIVAILDEKTCKRCTGADRLAHYDMSPRQWHPIRSNANLDSMYTHRAIVPAAHIILTSPNKFHRRAPQTFRDRSSFTRYVTIRNGAPAKTAAGKFGM